MMAEDDEAVLSEVRKLPLAERVSHKNWKARGEAYDSIASACERAVGNSDVAEFGAIREAETILIVAFKDSALASCLYTFGIDSSEAAFLDRRLSSGKSIIRRQCSRPGQGADGDFAISVCLQ